VIPALFTGSRVYGRPKKKSDLDLVLLVSEEELRMLKKTADAVATRFQYEGSTASFTFGRLNVIAVTDPVAFAVFEKATARLLDMKDANQRGVDRSVAVSVMENCRRRHGLHGRFAKTEDEEEVSGDPEIPF
jgi:hypothetical protein